MRLNYRTGWQAARTASLMALLGALILLVPVRPVSAIDQRRCAPVGAKTVRANTEVRVYRRGPEKYVCSLRTGKVRRLDRKDESIAYIYDVRGAYVAYEIYVTTRDRSFIAVRTVDARTGRFAVNAEAFTGAYRISRAVEAASRMQLVADGDVAWISRTGVDDTNREVRYASRGQAARVLATGADIDPRSLAVAPGYVYWLAAGAAQAARVP